MQIHEMKNNRIKRIIKGATLVVAWFSLSPLLLILDGMWKLLPKWLRIVLFTLSPMVLIVVTVSLILCYFYYCDYYYPRHHFVRPAVVENITGVRLPRYKVIEYYRGRRAFTRDYYDQFILEFKEMPGDYFYKMLQDNGFDCQDGCYTFRLNWGSGLVKNEVVPKGEKGNYDYSLEICEGQQDFTINVIAH